MIIPDNLSPFPVMPASGDKAEAGATAAEEFVSETRVRQLLVGPMRVTPMLTTWVPEDQGFAGRDDLGSQDLGDREALPFVVLSSDEAYQEVSAEEFEPSGPHPALAEPRHPVAPRPRIEIGARHRRRRAIDRWWVLGMGVALLVIAGSGVLVELVSDEAMRRLRQSQATESTEEVSPASGASQSLAVSNPEYPAP